MHVTGTALKATGYMVAALCTVAVASDSRAQSDEGGILMRFGVTLGAEAQGNRNLDQSDPGATYEAFTGLSFGLSTQTQTQSLAFDLSGRLRAVDAPDGVFVDDGFTNPSAALNYRLMGATSRLDLSARLSESDLSNTSLLLDDDGDFTIVAGDATRRRSVASARYDWNQDARVRYGAFARYEDTSYDDGVAVDLDGSTLNDSQRLTLGGNMSLDLTTAARLDISLTHSIFEEDGVAEDRETWSLGNTLTVARPRGNVMVNFNVTDTEDGTRVSGTLGRVYETPRATLSGEIGLSRGVTGDTAVIGALGAQYPLPSGALSLGLSRTVSSSNLEDEERLKTRATFGYQHALTPLSGLAFDLSWAESDDTASDASASEAAVSATYTRALTQDWNMNAGLRHRYSDRSGSGSAHSNEVFFNLRRDFVTRF